MRPFHAGRLQLEQVRLDSHAPKFGCDVYAGILAVYLFGSTAGGTAPEDSDVDVAVLLDADPPHRLNSPRFNVEGELERALGRPVDLVVLNDAPSISEFAYSATASCSSIAILRPASRSKCGHGTKRSTSNRS